MVRNAWLLALWALVAMAAALNLDGVEEYVHHGVKRQAQGTGTNTPTSTPASSSPPASSPPQQTSTPTPDSTTTPASTPDAQSTPTPARSTPPSQAPASSTPPPQSSAAPRSSQPAQSTKAPATSATLRTTALVVTTPLVATSLQSYVTVTRTTLPNGQESDITVSGVRSIAVTTGQATFTELPTSKGAADESSGLSDSNKKVIGGVVGGIGGALLLGGIALVFLRMRKRQSKVTADDDDLNLNTGAALGDKPQRAAAASPFQTNLEQYHNPGGRPNAASNF
ncbi:hypothetical protein ACEQ8H_001551 [Pleosporales sp. CAS-2024a]